MLIINPAIVSSSFDSFLNCEEDDGADDLVAYSRLMEFRGNEQLCRLLPGHDISFKLKVRDLDHKFERGDFFFVVKDGISILTIGVDKDISDDEIKDISARVLSENEDIIVLYDEMKDIPGAAGLFSELEKDKRAKNLNLDDLKSSLKKQMGIKQ